LIQLDDTDDPIDICMDNVFKAVFTKTTLPPSAAPLPALPHHVWSFAVGKTP
jgi:hypothetical protein